MEFTKFYEVTTTADSREQADANFADDGPECGPSVSEAVELPDGCVILFSTDVAAVLSALSPEGTAAERRELRANLKQWARVA